MLNIFSYDDSLTIYDGDSTASSMLGKYCGYSIPPSHVSSSNDILIHFQSDDYPGYGHTGFQIEYNPMGKEHRLIDDDTKHCGYTNFWARFSFVESLIFFFVGKSKLPLALYFDWQLHIFFPCQAAPIYKSDS